jgi:deoxyribonuclease-4
MNIWQPRDMHNFHFGLKLWSPNTELINEIRRVYDQGLFEYIELYVVPGTFDKTIATWRDLAIPYMLHCPHSKHDFNLAKKELRGSNAEVFKEVQQFADALNVTKIVVHSGNAGPLSEAVFQIQQLNEKRILIENKPKYGMEGQICVGISPEEISTILKETSLSDFVLDFSHAICAANGNKIDPDQYIRQFISMRPAVFHIGDGLSNGTQDVHYHFGEGDFDIAKILSYIPENAQVTIETPLNLQNGLKDFERNRNYLNQFLTETAKK